MGIILLLIGIAGLFLPILQGVAIIVAALAILRQDIPLAERIWQRWIIPLRSAYSSGYTPTTNDVPSAGNPNLKEGAMEKPWYFIQLSDTHIVADTRQELHGVNTYATLSRAIAQINHLDPPPAFAIFTGDLINDDDPQSYRVLQHLTRPAARAHLFCYGES